MINNRKQICQHYKCVTSSNGLNESIRNYEKAGKIEISIGLNTRNNYRGNDSDIINCEYLGITEVNNAIEKDDKIDNYLVEFAVSNKNSTMVYLKEINSNGNIKL